MPDSVSATLSISPAAAMFRYIMQTLFLFFMASIAATAVIMEWGHTNLWVMILVLSIAHMLNLPIIDIVQLVQQNYKTRTVDSPV